MVRWALNIIKSLFKLWPSRLNPMKLAVLVMNASWCIHHILAIERAYSVLPFRVHESGSEHVGCVVLISLVIEYSRRAG